MRNKIILILTIAMFVVVMIGMAGADEAKHAYVGAKKCKICHKKSGIFESWMATKHATAWDSLSDADKKKDEFKKYYTTGTTAKGVLLTGIQCEACHGPGADYKKKSVMMDSKKAAAAGLIMPDEKTCLKCHNDKAPGALGKTAKDFDFAKMKAKGIHKMPKKEEKK